MKKKQAIIFIHGIGTSTVGYSINTQQHLKDKIKKLGIDTGSSNFIFKEFVWSLNLSKTEMDLWGRIQDDTTSYGKKLNWNNIRKKFILFIGDSFLYDQGNIWNGLENGLNELLVQIEQEANTSSSDFEITIIAHSLGTVLLDDYLKKIANKENIKGAEILKNNRLVNVFTIGSPLAIHTLKGDNIGSAKPNIFWNREYGTWVNILDDDDVIAYPLKPINDSFNKAVDIDYITEVGSSLKPGLLFSHSSYWCDNNFISPVAQKLVMDYQRINNNIPYDKYKYHQHIQSLYNI